MGLYLPCNWQDPSSDSPTEIDLAQSRMKPDPGIRPHPDHPGKMLPHMREFSCGPLAWLSQQVECVSDRRTLDFDSEVNVELSRLDLVVRSSFG